MSPAAIKAQLAALNMRVNASGANGALLDMQARGLTELVRASVHYYNTEDEIERFCQALAELG